MLVPKNIHPDQSLYALGAALINELKRTKSVEVYPHELYDSFVKTYSRDISYSYFLYALDWLFLIGLLALGKGHNKIRKCF